MYSSLRGRFRPHHKHHTPLQTPSPQPHRISQHRQPTSSPPSQNIEASSWTWQPHPSTSHLNAAIALAMMGGQVGLFPAFFRQSEGMHSGSKPIHLNGRKLRKPQVWLPKFLLKSTRLMEELPIPPQGEEYSARSIWTELRFSGQTII